MKKSFLCGEMRSRNLVIIFIANLRFVFISAKVEEVLKTGMNQQIFQNYQYLGEKKVYFTKNSAQYIKFQVNISHVLDFAMCLWYKPTIILENNILFSYGNLTDQSVLWKIKKSQNNKPVITLKIFETLIMEEKIEGLIPGQWHHLCQYWQGSTGLWALFLNNYIVSFGNVNNTDNLKWCLGNDNSSATINHPRTKDSLYGEIYGFYLMSMDFKSQSNYLQSKSIVNEPMIASKLKKRQTDSIPVDAEPRPLSFFGKLFTFIRRVVSFVALPVFRFVRGLIIPWRKPFSSSGRAPENPKISDDNLPPSSVTEIITDFRSVTENITSKKGVRIETAIRSKANETFELDKKSHNFATMKNHSDFAKLEESLTIYEVESDADESLYLGNILNSINYPKPIHQTMNPSESQPEESSRIHTYFDNNSNLLDKCLLLEQSYKKILAGEKHKIKDGIDNESSLVDPITQLGTNLQFMQFLYACCDFRSEKILISWKHTKIILNNVVIESVAGCGNF